MQQKNKRMAKKKIANKKYSHAQTHSIAKKEEKKHNEWQWGNCRTKNNATMNKKRKNICKDLTRRIN